ncbi:unnamed protein product [Effrenium voratum]|uniref:Uncharacterized protein n=1 Tax=Effrenium voratum TaxID=2562239 RepID=A0AA36J490_9DINO|nr:unnamed protein product [Effrenium voratum]
MTATGLRTPTFGNGDTPVIRLGGKAPAFSVAARRRERAKAVLPRGVPLPAVAGRSWSSDRGQFGSGAVLVLTFLGSAVANRVANRILLVPMAKHSLFLSLATSAVQLTAYALLLACRAWRRLAVRPLRMFLADFWFPLCLTGLCEGCFYPLVFAAAAKLPGGLVQVLNQSIVPYTVLFSVLLLNRSYELIQLAGVAIVLLGVLLAAAVPPGVPHLPGQASLPDVLQCAGAYSLLAMGVTLKDLVLRGSEALSRQEAEALLKQYKQGFDEDGDPLRRRGPALACSACQLAAKRFQSKVASKVKGKMTEAQRRSAFRLGVEAACAEELFPQQMAVVEKEGKEFYVDFQEAMGSQHGRVSVKAMSPEIKADAVAACRYTLQEYRERLLREVLAIPRSGRGSDLDFVGLICGQMAKVCDRSDERDEL